MTNHKHGIAARKLSVAIGLATCWMLVSPGGRVTCASMVQAKASDALIVKDGQPRAEIVIAEESPRTTRLAAAELQTYVEKISGAKLPIATEPSADTPVQIYIGRSTHTVKLGITGEGLEQGAYRVVSGENWLVLIGDDTDSLPANLGRKTMAT